MVATILSGMMLGDVYDRLLLSSCPDVWSALGDQYTVSNATSGFTGTALELESSSTFSGRTKDLYVAATAGTYATSFTPLAALTAPTFENGSGFDLYVDLLEYVDPSTPHDAHFGMIWGSMNNEVTLGFDNDNGISGGAIPGFYYNVDNSQEGDATIASNTPLSCRIQVTTNLVRMKSWASGSSEPAAWDYSQSISTMPTGGGGIFHFYQETTRGTAGTNFQHVGGWALWQIGQATNYLRPWPVPYDFGT